MEIQNYRYGQDQHDHIREDVRKPSPAQPGIDIDAVPLLRPKVTERLAGEETCDDDRDPVQNDHRPCSVARISKSFVCEDAQIEVKNGQFWGHYGGEVEQRNDDDKLAPGDHHLWVGLADAYFVKADPAIFHISYRKWTLERILDINLNKGANTHPL